MSEVKPETGTPRLFYSKPVNDKGGPCHAHDCDHRSGCVLQLEKTAAHKRWKSSDRSGSFQVYRHLWSLWQTPSLRERMSHKKNVRVTNTNGRRLNARNPKQPPELPRMGTRVVKEEARRVAPAEPPTPSGAHQRPLLLPPLPMLTPRSAHRGITPPLRGLTPRRGDWPGRPSPSWLQGLM